MAGASALIYAGNGLKMLDGSALKDNGPNCALLATNETQFTDDGTGGGGSGGGNGFELLAMPPSPPPAGPSLPPGPTPLLVLGSCGGSSGHLAAETLTDHVHVTPSATTSTTTLLTAEHFSLYHLDFSTRLVDPGDVVLLKSGGQRMASRASCSTCAPRNYCRFSGAAQPPPSPVAINAAVGTSMYCRLARLAGAAFTGVVCDQGLPAGASVFLYTGRGLALQNGTVMATTGSNCELVTTNRTINDSGLGGSCTGSGCGTCSGSGCGGGSGVTFVPQLPPPPPAGPPIPPGVATELIGSCSAAGGQTCHERSCRDVAVAGASFQCEPYPPDYFVVIVELWYCVQLA
jgi:hypothetical protein